MAILIIIKKEFLMKKILLRLSILCCMFKIHGSAFPQVQTDEQIIENLHAVVKSEEFKLGFAERSVSGLIESINDQSLKDKAQCFLNKHKIKSLEAQLIIQKKRIDALENNQCVVQ